MLLVSETIARRNVAAIQPDRIQTRCRDDGALAQASRQANRSRLRDWSVPASDLIGTLRAAYHVVLQHNNGHPDRLPVTLHIRFSRIAGLGEGPSRRRCAALLCRRLTLDVPSSP
jgi:hypothetical protein